MTNAERAVALAKRIFEQIERGAGKGIDDGRKFLTARIKEELSSPAPRAKYKRPPRKGKVIKPYRAATRAHPFAPPRKLSGRLRGSITSRMIGKTRAIIGTNVVYARYHELSRKNPHPFLRSTAKRWKLALRRIIGRAVKVEVKAK